MDQLLSLYNDQASYQHALNPMRLQELVNQSLDILEAVLMDESIPARDRALVALQILERVGDMKRLKADEPSLHPTYLASSTPMEESIGVLQPKTLSAKPILSAMLNSSSNGVIAASAQFAEPHQAITQEAILQINFIQIDNFLSSEEFEQAMQIAFSHEAQFTDSSVHNKKHEQVKQYRQSAVLHHKHYATFADFFQQKVIATLPSVLNSLNRPHFEVSNSVIQLTAHNDGSYYTVHSDANTEATKTREMTYVYYFYKQPKTFSGGELRMYETGVDGQSLYKRGMFKDIEPRNNSIVFFPSRLLHEVMPVNCPSKQFEDSRFTFNGWLRR